MAIAAAASAPAALITGARGSTAFPATHTPEALAPAFESALAQMRDVALIGVDIPIGLPESGARDDDLAARAFVGPRRSNVFPTPTRAAIASATYAEARRVLPSLSAQPFALGKKILEVEASLHERVFEVHPEVSFAALAGQHLRFSKRSSCTSVRADQHGLDPPLLELRVGLWALLLAVPTPEVARDPDGAGGFRGP